MRIAHPEEEMDRAPLLVFAHEAHQRADPRARADQDQWRARTVRPEGGVASDEGADALAGFERRQLARAQPAGMLLDDDLQKPVAARRRERIEARSRRPFGQYPDQISCGKPRKTRPRQPLPKRGARQRKAQDRRRRLHVRPIIAPRLEREVGRGRGGRLVVQFERDPEHRTQRLPPAREGLRRLTVDRVIGQQNRPTLRIHRLGNRLGVGAIGRETPVPETEHGNRDIQRIGAGVEFRQEAFRGTGLCPVAISRREHDDPIGPGVALGDEGRHRRDMNTLARRTERCMQGRGKAPGTAAFTADKEDRLRARGWLVVPDARAAAPTRKPDRQAGEAQDRHAQRHEAEHRAKQRRPLPRMQRVDGFRDALPCGQVRPGEHRAGALIEIAGAAIGLQRENIGGIPVIGEAQTPQFRDGRVAEHRKTGKRHVCLTAHLGGDAERGPAIGDQLEGRGRHPQGGGGGEKQADHRDARDLDVEPTGERPAQTREPVPPAANSPRDEQDAGDQEHQHRDGAQRACDAAGIAEKEGAVKVGQPTLKGIRISRCDAAARGGIYHRRAGLSGFEPVGRDLPRGCAPDLFETRIDRLDALGEGRDAELRPRLRCRDPLRNRKDREHRAAERQHRDKRQGDQPRPAMKRADHGLSPHMS